VILHLVRHGRTAANAEGLLLGRRDPALDPEGVRQAAAVAARVAATVSGDGPVRVVSSPLQRCLATATGIADALAVGEIEVDPRWIELDYGDLEGVPLADVPAETWAAWRADVHWRPPGGETLFELGERVRDACAELAAACASGGSDVVVVTHVSPLKAAVAWALGVGDETTWHLFVGPASISRVAVRPGGATSLHVFNERTHLDG
jgi:broad specificity phosphatase PhoE